MQVKIAEALNGIELTDEQVKALDGFFADFAESAKASAKKNLLESGEFVSRNQAERAFTLFENDARNAFDRFEKDAEKAFDIFYEDAERAFDLGVADTQREYTENMARALKDVYDDVHDRVKKDFAESAEYRALEQVRRAMQPVLLDEGQKAMVEEIEKVRADKTRLEGEKKELERGRVVDTLMKGFPAEYEESTRTFISNGKTIDEVYERFSTMVDMIKTGALSKKAATTESEKRSFKRKVVAESVAAPAPKPATKPVFESKTMAEADVVKKDESFNGFNELDQAILRTVFSTVQ